MVVLVSGGCANSTDHRFWAEGLGGAEQGPELIRAQRIVERLQTGLAGSPLRVAILRTDTVSAYSFSDGSVFLTRGLMKQADDDEIAAAIAHELGHLLSDGHVQGPAALRGYDQGLDIEAKADAVGCKVLELHGISSVAMIHMLQLVAADTPSHQCCDDLCRRICRLKVEICAVDRQ